MQNTPSNPMTFRRLRRYLTSTLLAVCAVAGIIAGTTQPAHAATSVHGCFFYENGDVPADPITVQLLVWVGNGWRFLNSARMTNGCVSIPMTLGYEYHTAILYVHDQNFGGTIYGSSQYYADPGLEPDWVGFGILRYTCAGRVRGC